MSDTLLDYQVLTHPDPFKVSPQTGAASIVTLTIIVSKPPGPVAGCSRIKFSFDQGVDASNFFSDASGIHATASPGSGWTIKQDGADFIATPLTPNDGLFGRGLSFVLSNIKVNTQAGPTFMTVAEDGQAAEGPRDIRQTRIKLEKGSLMDDTLLSYQVLTNPDPLQASPQKGQPSLATLTIVVSNPTRESIDCSQIRFLFSKGDNANQLFSDETGIGSTTTGGSGWTIGQDVATFTATPKTSSDGEVGPDGLNFVLSNIKVNDQSGTTLMRIEEDAAQPAGSPPAPQATRKATVALVKGPLGFAVGELKANPMIVKQGDPTTLSWAGTPGPTYELLYENPDGNTVTVSHVKGQENQPLPPTGSYTIDNLQTNPTIFYLRVKAQVDGANDHIVVERTCPVSISRNPPKITRFDGAIKCISSKWYLVLNWDTTDTDYCTITDDSHRLNPTSIDGSYNVELRRDDPAKTYTLKASNTVDSATANVTVSWQWELVNSVKVGNSARCVAVSPDGATVYVTSYTDKTVTAFDAETLVAAPTPPGNLGRLLGGRPSGIAASPDGTKLYVASGPDDPASNDLGGLGVYDLQPTPMAPQFNFVGRFEIGSVAVSTNGAVIYVTNNVEMRLLVIDNRSLKPIGNPANLPMARGVAVSPDGSIYVASEQSLDVLGDQTLQPIRDRVDLSGFLIPNGGSVAASPDGLRIYLLIEGNASLLIYNAKTLELAATPVASETLLGVAASPTKPLVYGVSATGMLYMFSEATAKGGTMAPVIHSFSASPMTQANAEDPITLSWYTQNADSVWLAAGGDVLNALPLTQVQSSGTIVDKPFGTVTYTLTCKGRGPDVVQTIAITRGYMAGGF